MADTLASVGEFGLIARLERLLAAHGVAAPGLVLGLGDDTAAFQPQPGQQILLTCDVQVAGRHYLPQVISPRQLGRRCMAVNLSDIAAMGGQPLYALVSLGLERATEVAMVEEMYLGFLDELNPHGAAVIGGNLTQSAGPSFIDVTLIGQAPAGQSLGRRGAKPGEAILVTGWPGQAAAGLRQLLNPPQGQEPEPALLTAYLTPTPRCRLGRAAAQSGLASAMIDISDGLLGDLDHICRLSGVGALLQVENLPVSPALARACAQWGQDPLEVCLGASDDYELIITCPEAHVPALLKAMAAVDPTPVRQVGSLLPAGQGLWLETPQGRRRLHPAGWDHFAPPATI